jgi:redox-sensitive bicupin YhaK (pirin superfamily)
MPTWTGDDGRARVKVIAGSALGVNAIAQTCTPITYLDVALEEGAEVALDIPAAQNAFVFVFGGALAIGEQARTAKDGDMALVSAGDVLRLVATVPASRALVIAGEPLREPVARYGPFVMNTPEEIMQAFNDYQSGRFGQIARNG